jgi:hypothetical protein
MHPRVDGYVFMTAAVTVDVPSPLGWYAATGE